MANLINKRTSIISNDSLEFLSESSSLGFFKHDIKRKSFSFDSNSVSGMGMPAETYDIPEDDIKLYWGDKIFKEYYNTITNNFNLNNYKFTLDYNFERDCNIGHSKIHIVLFADDNGELSYIEAIFFDNTREEKNDKTSSLFQENQFRNILNSINSLVFIVDIDFNIVDCNFEGQKIFSACNEQNSKSIPLNKYFTFCLEDIEMVFKTGKPLLGYKSPLLASEEIVRNYIFNVAKIDNLNRSPYLLFSGIDITETLALEDQLIVNDLKFRSLVEQSPLGINIYDNNAVMLDTNLAAMKILGVSSKDGLIGSNMFDCFNLSSNEVSRLEKGEVLFLSKSLNLGEVSKRFNLQSSFHDVKYLELTLLKLHSDKINSDLGYIELISDKTYEHNVYESLRKSSNQLSLATSTGNVGIYEINLLNRTYIANSETVHMFDNVSLESSSRLDDFYKRVHPEDLNNIISEADLLKSGKSDVFSTEFRVKLANGKWKWIKTTASISERDEKNEAVRVVGVNIDIDDLKKAKEDAIKREDLLKQTLNIGEIGLWEYDAEKDIISLGASLKNALNLAYSSFGDRDFSAIEFFDIVHPDDKLHFLAKYDEIYSGSKDFLTSECRLNDLYDNLCVSVTVFVNERNSDGVPLKMNGSIMNVNEKNFALEEAKRMEYFVATSLEIAKVGYFYKYHGSDKVEISDTCCEIYGLNEKCLIDYDCFISERVHPLDRRKYRRFSNSIEEQCSSELRDINYRIIINGDIRRLHEYVTVRFDENNKRLGTLFAVQDVTDYYEKETRLQELLDSQRFVAEVSVMMMSVVEPTEMVEKLLLNVKSRMKATKISYYLKTDSSYVLKNMLGPSDCPFPKNDVVIEGRDIEYLISKISNNNPLLLDSFKGIKSDDSFIEDEFFMTGHSTLFLPIIVRNSLYGFLALNIDIKKTDISDSDFSLLNSFLQIVNLAFEKLHGHTELVEAKNKAEEADRLKTAFLANMSHEIRTPLNSVVGFSQLIAESVEDSDDDISDYVSVLNRNTDQLLSIVNNVIDFSEIESSSLFIKHKVASIEQMFDDIYNSCTLRYKDSIDVIYSKPPGEEVFLDSDLLRVKQILQNLICNAFKYTSQGHVEYGYKAKDDGVLFHVFDTGVGIKEEYKEKVFERFFQIDEMVAGTGLGLCIVRALVDELKGDLWFDSKDGEGLKFYVYIPNFKE